MRDFLSDYTPHLILGGLITVILFFTIDYILGKEFTKNAVVLEKSYTPSGSSAGTGFTSDGKATVVTTYHSEEYILFVELTNGEVITYSTNKQFWLSVDKGDEVNLTFTKGFITGITY